MDFFNLKLLFFLGGSYVAGLESVALTLMKSLDEAGHSTAAVISGWNDGVYPEQLSKAGVQFRQIKLGRIYKSKPLWTIGTLTNLPRAIIELRRFVKEFKPDLIIHSDISFSCVAMSTLPSGARHVFYLHNVPDRKFLTFASGYVLRKCSGVIVVSEFIRAKLIAQIGKRIPVQTVLNGIGRCVAPVKTPSGKLNIGIVGQLIYRKRHHLLMEAVSRLDEKIKMKICVRVYGNPNTPYADRVREQVSEAGIAHLVEWMGFISKIDEVYCNLDILAAPAVDEPFGMTLIEAGNFGIPVIAARSGAFDEIVVDGVTGLLISADDPVALSQAIKVLVEDRDLRIKMGDNGQRHVFKNFTATRMAEDFISAIEILGTEVPKLCL